MSVAVNTFRSSKPLIWLRVALFALALVAVVSLALEHGFREPPVPVVWLQGLQMLVVGAFVLARVAELVLARAKGAFFRSNWFDFAFILVGAGLLAVELEMTGQPILKVGTIYVITMQGLLAVRVALGAVRFQLLLAKSALHPARLMLISFAVVIVIGAAALALPKATRPSVVGESYYLDNHILNCLFTATSATCVTGLIIYDTGHDFTLFGQAVILVLIQLGGLGIMIFGAVFGLLAGRQLSLRESLALQDTLSHETFGQITRMIKFICLSTFLFEAVGAAILWTLWPASMPVGARAFHSVFHAVSAFCNAGFALQADSFVQHRMAWQVYMSIMPLAILGSIGFPVLYNLWEIVGKPASGGRSSRWSAQHLVGRLSLHSKIVLIATVILIVIPGILLTVFETPSQYRGSSRILLNHKAVFHESDEAMSGMEFGERLLAGLFQSVTTRTVGFNTARIDTEGLSPASHFLMIVLMFIGGSPVSTAGGAKTVSLAVLCLAVIATLRRRQHVEFAHRTIPDELVRRAGVIVIAMALLVCTAATVLCYTERATLTEALFESVSACSTVGLSTGLTPRLTEPGRIVIIAAMFAGRLGPLTLLIALVGRYGSARYEYPSENVVIG